jgi:TonB family protein
VKYLRLIIILLLTCPSPGKGQIILDTMYFDKNWEQCPEADANYYRIVSTDTTSDSFRFFVQDFYLSGQLQMKGTYKSIRPDNKDGLFIYYYENGQPQRECHYRENTLNGKFREWYKSGQQKNEQEYRNDLLDGPFKAWREDGSLKQEAHYVKGERSGYFKTYYENGQLTRNDLYEKGRLVEGFCYSPDGEPTEYFPYIVMPKFQNGATGLRKYIEREIRYPTEARKSRDEGYVVVIFIVDENGHVKDTQIVDGDRDYFNEEALRVVNSFPEWIPGEIDGIPSPIHVTVPIEFSLH